MGARAGPWILVLVAAAAAAGAVLALRHGDESTAVDRDDEAPLPAARELPVPPPPPPAVAVLRGRVGPGGPVLSMDDAGPVPRAVGFLLSCQGDDGLFHASRGALGGDPAPEVGHDLALSGWIVLALLDAVDPEGASAGAVALRRSLDAMAKIVGVDVASTWPRDVEGYVLATWALAAGCGRTGNEAWRTPLPAAVARVLAAKAADGGWRTGRGDADDDLLLTFEVMGLAAEVRPMHRTFPDPASIDEAIESAGDWALSVRESRGVPIRGPGVVALEFLLRLIDESYPLADAPARDLVTGPPPAFAVDHTAVLLGSVLRFPRGGKVAIEWNHDVLEPAALLQKVDEAAVEAPLSVSRGTGSWDPNDARSKRYGRAYATALETLAWLFPRVPYRDPKGS